MAAGGVKQATAALENMGTLPVESLAGPVNDPRRREFLQGKLDEGLVKAQRGIVADQEKALARYQAEYRRLTGGEFNTALCGDTQRQIRRREAWEAKRRDEERQRNAQQIVANEAEGAVAICREKQAMDGPSKDVAGLLPADQVAEIQQRGRENYGRLVVAYERAHGKRFDPVSCRPVR